MSSTLRSRIAPTPSGFLHMGNLHAFVLTWLITKMHGGTLLLRIDDMDAQRVRPAYLDDIFSTLDWIGLTPDAGPSGAEDFLQNHTQHLRLPLYRQLLQQLMQTGLTYPCTCTRKMIAEQSRHGIYPGTCRHKPPWAVPPAHAALRIQCTDMPVYFQGWYGSGQPFQQSVSNLSETMGDFILQRKDGLPAYQVCSLADDMDNGINLIVRGSDLLPSTAAQVWLAQLLHPSSFPHARFVHHTLLTLPGGVKISKSAGHTSVQYLRRQGFTQAQALSAIATWIGLPAFSGHSLSALLDTVLTFGIHHCFE